MIDFDLARVESGSTYVACGAFETNNFFSQVCPSLPAFFPVPDLVIGEKVFAFHALSFLLDLFFFGIGIVPGFCHKSFGFVLAGHDQVYCPGSEGIALLEPLHYGWDTQFVLSA